MTKYLISLLPIILFPAPSFLSFISVGCKWQKRREDSAPVTLDLCWGEIDTTTCLQAPWGQLQALRAGDAWRRESIWGNLIPRSYATTDTHTDTTHIHTSENTRQNFHMKVDLIRCNWTEKPCADRAAVWSIRRAITAVPLQQLVFHTPAPSKSKWSPLS